ncbi:MAG: zinc ribbon domain-containing protein [Gammaproteobacteria bacterium]|nr:zinc ribbon domain-containing protein [Gammaproteobacteria bacterium]
MPIYEYRCESCHYDFEKLQKMSDPELTECPECGKSSLKKLVSAAGFRLKGSGWYETDFKNKPKKESTAKKEGDSKKSGEDKTKTSTSKSSEK